jgi:hypothetical protein
MLDIGSCTAGNAIKESDKPGQITDLCMEALSASKQAPITLVTPSDFSSWGDTVNMAVVAAIWKALF